MTATPTRVYPLRDHYVMDVPHVEHEYPTKAEAESLVTAYPDAFTLDPRHPDRESPAPEPAPAPEMVSIAGLSDSPVAAATTEPEA